MSNLALRSSILEYVERQIEQESRDLHDTRNALIFALASCATIAVFVGREYVNLGLSDSLTAVGPALTSFILFTFGFSLVTIAVGIRRHEFGSPARSLVGFGSNWNAILWEGTAIIVVWYLFPHTVWLWLFLVTKLVWWS
ncbi:MAG TPA: hypothetical protein VMZ73_06410, partial [Acidimicrobiales bacterium]|nr:hypothetical protein [Acidimicrobiales bacterium]